MGVVTANPIEVAPIPGGSFLISNPVAADIFTPEEFSHDQKMYAKTTREFIEKEVLPHTERIEGKDLEFLVTLMRQAGELGLLMADVPEQYGGLGLDKASSALIAESAAGQAAFQITMLVQTGIGTLPLVYYGTEEQKQRYLPGLANGSLLSCYALTEPTAGSDALACRTRAMPSEDGSLYVLDGTKQFITNARIADVLTVFAKVGGEQLTAFLVDAGTAGLSFGPDEKKMGLHGATTCTVVLDGVKVPAGNVLGEVGRGHKIAFNILNIGRFKLGAVAVGAAKRALEQALAYCLERKQFGRRIAEFGAIREKLGQMYARLYAAEAATYRTVGLVDHLLATADAQGSAGAADPGRAGVAGEAELRSIEEYSVECAMVKVLGTEMLDYVVDETVQCFGGYGYCAEYPVEGYYRDSRINRIYEGTNEINRIIVPTMLLRRAVSGRLPLTEAFAELRRERTGAGTEPSGAAAGPLAAEGRLVANLKKICLLVLGLVAERHGKGLAVQQAMQLRIADLAILAYTAESTWLRAGKVLASDGEQAAALPVAAARISCEEAVDRAETLARQALVHLGEREALGWLGSLLQRAPVDVVALREAITSKLVEAEHVPI